MSAAAVSAFNSNDGTVNFYGYLENFLEQLGNSLEGHACVVEVPMLKDCVHHLGITSAHSLVQNWKAKKWNLTPLYSHTFWQIPKPLWKVSIWIKGQYSLQSGTQAAAPPDLYDHDYLLLALTWLRREENIALLASWANPTIVPFPPFLTTGSEILTVSSELAFTVWSHNCGDGQVGFVLCISLLSQLKITLRVILRVWECAKQVKRQDFTGKYYYFQL